MNNRDEKRASGTALWKRILLLLSILMAVAALLILGRSAANRFFLARYRQGAYSEYPEKLLLPLALGENYVAPYNLGNVAFQRGNYDRDVEYYNAALSQNPPEAGRECSVRVNLALAMLHTFPFETLDTGDGAQVQQARETLLHARAVLTRNGCACEEKGAFDGHSEEAEALKRDIDQMLDRLSQLSSGDGEGDADDGEGDGSGGSDQVPSQDESQQDEQEKDSDSGEDGQTQEARQQALEERLDEQKQELEAGSYRGSGYDSYTYIESSETIGYGEGAPW